MQLPLFHLLSKSRLDLTSFSLWRHFCWIRIANCDCLGLRFAQSHSCLLLVTSGLTRSHFGLPFCTRCLAWSDYIHDCVLIAVCLTRSSVAQPPITNETALSDSGVKPSRLSLPHTFVYVSVPSSHVLEYISYVEAQVLSRQALVCQLSKK